MKKIFAIIALAAMTLIYVPEGQAQTAAQQKELDEIAQRSMNGLSAKDRKRVVQILTDEYVKQGMPKEQAAQMAGMAADSMFSSDVGEATPEERRQFEEQQRQIEAFEEMQKPQPPNNAWPAAGAFARYGKAIAKPAIDFNGEYEQDGDKLTIRIENPHNKFAATADFKGFTQAEIKAVCRVFEKEFGAVDSDGKNWRDKVAKGQSVTLRKADPKHKNTAEMRYWIELEIKPFGSADKILGFTIKISVDSGATGGAA